MESTFTPHHSLDRNTLSQLARLLNVVAYNAPDAPYVPLLHPVAGLLLEAGLSEEEVDDYKASYDHQVLVHIFLKTSRSTRLAVFY